MKSALLSFLVFAMNIAAQEDRDDVPAAAVAARVAACLPNACGVMATVFLQRYLAACPAETGGLFPIEVGEDEGRATGHALALFSHAGTTWIYDHEAGLACTGIPVAEFDHRAHKPAVVALYRARLREALRAWRGAPLPAVPNSPAEMRDCVALARQLLGTGLPSALIKIRGRDDYVCAWAFNGYVWAYSPARGTTWIRPDGIKPLSELVRGALARFGIHQPFDPVTLPPAGADTSQGI
jgi:hypothetical protein